MECIRSLADVNRHDVALVGGKAANLGELVQMGLPVPPAFILLTSAYTIFVEANALAEEIERVAEQASSQSLQQLEETSCAMRSLFERSAIPPDIAQAILGAYRDLSGDAVAVRSSATAEDLPGTSFAGQQETLLNVRGEEALLEAVKRSWASLWTARALAYRIRWEISSQSASIAAIVQQMVPADAAGILFTVNPVTGAQDEIVMNASWGLGEAIVGGRVNPDTLRVEKATGRIIEMKIGEKAVMTVRKEQGTGEVAVQDERRHQQVLSPEHVAELVRLACEIAAHFGGPQDIEWALAGEKIFLLQARPVTALSSPGGMQAGELPVPPGDDAWDSEGILPPQPFDLWTRTNVGENLPFPITPLTNSGFPALFGLDKAPQSEPPIQGLRRFYGRVYLNEGRSCITLRRAMAFLPRSLAGSGEVIAKARRKSRGNGGHGASSAACRGSCVRDSVPHDRRGRDKRPRSSLRKSIHGSMSSCKKT